MVALQHVVVDTHVARDTGHAAGAMARAVGDDARAEATARAGTAQALTRGEATATNPRAAQLSAVVLCGGKSSRMGRDKAHLKLGSRSLLERSAALLREVTQDVRLACGAQARYEELGLPLVLDRVVDVGPLAGLEATLASAPAGHVLAIACDMPRLDARALRRLVDFARVDDLDVALIASERGIEPLCAVWSTRMLAAVRGALDTESFKVAAALTRSLADGSMPRIGLIAERELVRDDSPTEAALPCATLGLVSNVNTPEDYARELALDADPLAREPRGAKARR